MSRAHYSLIAVAAGLAAGWMAVAQQPRTVNDAALKDAGKIGE
jgi:hypothetical protein